MLLDLVKAKALSADQVSCRALIGTAKVAGKSLVDVLVFKHELLKYFVNTLPDILGIRPDVKQKLKDITVDIPTYRAAAGYAFNPSFMTVKTTFKAGWPLSADAFFDMVDGTVFGYAYDEAIRQQWKASVSKKKEIIGKDGIILVGGANPIETKAADKVKKKGTTDRRVYVQRVSHKPSHDRHKRV